MAKRKNANAIQDKPATEAVDQSTVATSETKDAQTSTEVTTSTKSAPSFATYAIITAFHLIFLAFTHYALNVSLSPIYGNVPSNKSAGPPVFLTFFICNLLGHYLRAGRDPFAFSKDINRALVIRTCASLMACWSISAPIVLNGLARVAKYMGPYVGPYVERLVIETPLILVGGCLSQLYVQDDYSQDPNMKRVQLILYAFFEPLFMSTVVLGFQDRIFSYFPQLDSINQVHIFRAAAMIPYFLSLFSFKFLTPAQQPTYNAKTFKARRHLVALPMLILALTFTHPIYSFSNSPADYPYRYYAENHKVLHRERSITGWISVGEAPAAGSEGLGREARYLRADHSLLGGIWIGLERSKIGYYVEKDEELKEELDEKAVENAESIYTTFILQEAVKLVERTSKPGKERGLIIGLGTGIAARSLQAMGVNTTIVEIDPVVYKLARRYFGVEEPEGGVVLEDANKYLTELVKYRRWKERKYDYVIHDVFTGGSVPSSLFTYEFWQRVREVMAVNGVLAVNFAGEIKADPSQIILQTILKSFRGNCRAFEDGFQGHDEEQESEEFKNMVVFCQNTPLEPGTPPSIKFRAPTDTDFLPTISPIFRRRVLTSFQDNEMDLKSWINLKKNFMLAEKNAPMLDKAQAKGSYKHWYIMRKVFEDEVWRWY